MLTSAQAVGPSVSGDPDAPETGTAPAGPARAKWTLRARLVAALLVLATGALTAFTLASGLLIQRSLMSRVDAQLTQFVDDLKRPRPGPALPRAPASDMRGDSLPTEFRVVVVNRDRIPIGSLGREQGEMGGPDLSAVDIGAFLRGPADPVTVADQAGGASWRVDVFSLPDGNVAVVALSLANTEATVRQLFVIEAGVGVLVLVLLGAVAHGLVRVGLRPLTRIEHTAEQIAAGELDRRVPDTDPSTEAGRLGVALNTMLGRLSTALRARQRSEERLRRFVADASHELRTPLTSIRGFAELYRRGGAPDRADVDRLLGRIESEAMRMSRLVEDLLLLARMDEERALDLVDLDLTTLAAEVVQDARVREPDRAITLDAQPEPVRVIGDEYRLRQVVTNLVNNALTHTPAGTPVAVRVRAGRSGAEAGRVLAAAGAVLPPAVPVGVIEVGDQGPGVPADQAPHVFDRFYRADPARSRQRGGAGLGLAISAAILEAHRGRIELHAADGGTGAVFRVLVPVT
ncbi:sensor histidine kinase [Goodfellowiella coeruleoviolacea]|uniref:histidine kinase n=1 Tax=Goodfellowiella coeruleoviolacea TaxID=334858 RepID=A0AAE3GHM5_9PSEU|nr:HAMP domain-containing sensor histidine kinase [Goodfellowiella coeruleoviolacea]MCP2168371.1 two-component system, OmpR family, sensor kinase [Goodfellowiella coeruleoviolacea]